MQVKKLSLDHFRNYESCVFEPGPGINLIVGENAQGKTNLLEAIFYCCFGRSHRTSRDKEMIAYDAPQALIRLESVRTDTLHELSVRLSQAEGRRIKADGLPLTARRSGGAFWTWSFRRPTPPISFSCSNTCARCDSATRCCAVCASNRS